MDMAEVARFIGQTSQETRVYVGCDSVLRSRGGRTSATYATVVVVHLDGCRGCKVFGRLDVQPDSGTMKARLLQEAWKAGEGAAELLPHLGDREMEDHLDIHTDPTAGSHIAIKEAAGYIRGLKGLVAHFKPNACIASACADRYARLAMAV
jgi:predicted RNase H-related nuclease YkuK (DUF458 family)